VATVDEGGIFRLTLSPALSVALREAERMAREALEMGKGVGGSPLEGLAVKGVGWTDELVMALADGIPVSGAHVTMEAGSLMLRIEHADAHASLTLRPGEFEEQDAHEFVAALGRS
jgi:hypothetical protein